MTDGHSDRVAQPTDVATRWLSWPAWTTIGSLAAVLGVVVALAAWWYPVVF